MSSHSIPGLTVGTELPGDERDAVSLRLGCPNRWRLIGESVVDVCGLGAGRAPRGGGGSGVPAPVQGNWEPPLFVKPRTRARKRGLSGRYPPRLCGPVCCAPPRWPSSRPASSLTTRSEYAAPLAPSRGPFRVTLRASAFAAVTFSPPPSLPATPLLFLLGSSRDRVFRPSGSGTPRGSSGTHFWHRHLNCGGGGAGALRGCLQQEARCVVGP